MTVQELRDLLIELPEHCDGVLVIIEHSSRDETVSGIFPDYKGDIILETSEIG